MIQIHRILCPVDLSDCSRVALAHALVLARQQGAVVTALHLIPAPMLVGAGRSGRPGEGAAPGDPEERCLEKLRSFVGPACAGEIPIEIRIEYGEPAAGILEQAALTRADLVVLACQPGVSPGPLGSVAKDVLAKATLPVLTIPPRCHAPRQTAGPRRVVCGLDLSRSSLAALQYAAALARHAGAKTRLVLVHVLEAFPHEDVTPDSSGVDLGLYWRYRDQDARTSLAELAATHASGCATEVVVTTGRPWLEILDIAATRDADLIVVGTHGEGAPAGHVGCTADGLVRDATCPVLTVRGSA